MSISRFATIGLACLVASACTVVVREAEPPEVAPQASRPEPPSQNHPPVEVTTANLGIPPGHLPPPGSCRVWIEGTPPGRQARARSCHGILAAAPAGSWILYRPAQYQRQLRVRYLHQSERVVVAVRAFDAETGLYLRDLALGEDDDNMRPLYPADQHPTVRPRNDTPDTRRGNTGNRGDENRSGVAGDKSRGQDRGNATGQTDSTGNRRTVGGNAGNRGEDNQSGVADDRARGQNRADSTAQADTTGNRRTTGGNVGNRGDDNRSGVADDKSRGQNRGDTTLRTDTTSNARTTGGTGVATAARADTSSNRRSAGVTSGIVTEESRGNKQRDQSDRTGAAGETRLDTDGQIPLSIDARQLPPRGQCRVWIPGQPAERQAKAASCNGIAATAPAGAWILRRSANQPDVILVDHVDATRPGVVVRTSSYDAATGTPLQAQQPQLR